MNPDTDLETRLHDELRNREPAFTMSIAPSFAVARRVRRRRLTASALGVGGLLASAVLVGSHLLVDDRGRNDDVARDSSVSGVATQRTGSPDPVLSEKDQRPLLDAVGWELDRPGSDGDTFRNGEAFLEITRYPAYSYDDYVLDREHISDPPAPGAPVEVMGRSAQMWAYSPDDHAVIREVVDAQWMEFRGQGMDRAAYLDLLSQLRMVSPEEFDAAMPAKFVTISERPAAIEEILAGIGSSIGPAHDVFPGQEPQAMGSAEADPYQLGADVAGRVACAWLDQYAQAQSDGDAASAAAAAEVLATTRKWPVLQEMVREGGYPDVIWDYSDAVSAGQVPAGYRGGLGC